MGFDPSQSDFDFNTYRDLPATTTFQLDAGGYGDLASWTAVTGGFDANSSVAAGPPTDAWIFLRPNRYERERAHLIVYNWPGSETVAVDFGSLWHFIPGDEYRVLDVEDVWGIPVAAGIYDGDPVNVTVVGDYAPQFATYLVHVTRRFRPEMRFGPAEYTDKHLLPESPG